MLSIEFFLNLGWSEPISRMRGARAGATPEGLMNRMLLLIAYVRRSKRTAVEQVLRESGVSGWTESSVSGHGRAAAGHGVEHLRLEVLVPASEVERIAGAVSDAAHTGSVGDGMVLALPLEFARPIHAEPGPSGSE